MLLPSAVYNYRIGHFLVFRITWEAYVVGCKFGVSLTNCIVRRLSWNYNILVLMLYAELTTEAFNVVRQLSKKGSATSSPLKIRSQGSNGKRT